MIDKHLCAGCHHRWDGELRGAELCGDCWRKAQGAIFATPPARLEEAALRTLAREHCRHCGRFTPCIDHPHESVKVDARRIAASVLVQHEGLLETDDAEAELRKQLGDGWVDGMLAYGEQVADRVAHQQAEQIHTCKVCGAECSC